MPKVLKLPTRSSQASPIAPTERIIEAVSRGEIVVLIDDENRENEGDLYVPAEYADAEAVNFMARQGCGLICVTITQACADHFKLKQMTPQNTDPHHTAFTVSVDARVGISTGISAADRARTIDVLLSERGQPGDLVSPGHMFPLVAKQGGVLSRSGHTEASVELSRLAGLKPAGVICEIMNEDGTMARLQDLIEFADRHNLLIGTIADLIAYKLEQEIPPAFTSEVVFGNRSSGR